MSEINNSQAVSNWYQLAKEQTIIIMANDFIEGTRKGFCNMQDLERYEVMEWANDFYVKTKAAHEVAPLTLASVLEAIKIVITQLENAEDWA